MILFMGGGVSASVHAGIPPQEQTPQEQAPPWEQTPPGADIPPEQTPSPCRACLEIWSTRGQYASYWNAILFKVFVSDCRSPLSRTSAQPLFEATDTDIQQIFIYRKKKEFHTNLKSKTFITNKVITCVFPFQLV